MRDRSGDPAAALYVIESTFISLSDEDTVPLIAEGPTPEQRIIKNDLVNRLSADARWLLSALQSHGVAFTTPVTGKITKYSLTRTLRSCGWTRRKIDIVLKEIEKFMDEYESI